MRAHTHKTRPSPVITVQLKEQQITDCTFLMSACVSSCALKCECVLTCPDISSRCFGNRGQSSLTQLKTVYRKMCVKESQETEKKNTPCAWWTDHMRLSGTAGERKDCTICRTGKLRSSQMTNPLAKGQWSDQTSSALSDMRLVPCLGRVKCLRQGLVAFSWCYC